MPDNPSNSSPIVEEKLQYWKDTWADLIYGLEEGLSDVRLLNPHLLLLDIADEIKNNSFANRTAEGYFKRRLNSFVKDDRVIRQSMSTDFALIRRVFGMGQYAYLLQLCQSVVERFQTGEYFNALHSELVSILLSDTWHDEDTAKVTELSHSLIIELLIKGYSLDSVSRMPGNLLSSIDYLDDSDNITSTSFPHGISYEEFTKQHSDAEDTLKQERYNAAIKEKMNKLTVEDRLASLLQYFNKQPMVHTFIYQIKGLKGEEDIKIGEVIFYSTKTRRYLDMEKYSSFLDEDFGTSNETQFMNAAVEISFVDVTRARADALAEIEQALDVLSCYFTSTASPEINSYQVISVKADGSPGTSATQHPPTTDYMKWARGLTLEKGYLSKVIEDSIRGGINRILRRSQNRKSELEQTIIRSLHWYRKGETSLKLEDQLLNYWIAIEKMVPDENAGIFKVISDKNVTKFDVAKELIACLKATDLYDVGWRLFFLVRREMRSIPPTREGEDWSPRLPLTPDLMAKSGLQSHGRIELKPFIENLDAIKAASKLIILNGKIDEAIMYYSDPIKMCKYVENKIERVKEDVTLLYWHRNKIVHDAHFDNTLFPFYVPRAKFYTAMLLQQVIKAYSDGVGSTMDELLLSIYSTTDLLREKLKKNETPNLFTTE